MTWDGKDQFGEEAGKCIWRCIPYLKGMGLDLGSGPKKIVHNCISIDMQNGDIKRDIRDLSIFASNSLDFVFSSHALEDLEDTEEALREWYRVIRDGGYLVLYLPHAEYYPNIGQPGANPSHKHDFIPDDIIKYMRKIDPEVNVVRADEHNEFNEYSFEVIFQKNGDTVEGWRDAEKSCLVIRYGAFGDVIQASSILPKLKHQGYNITFMCVEKGYAVIKEDPHVDQFIVQGEDQIPISMLDFYWGRLVATGWWDKIVNLTETAEGTMLTPETNHKARWDRKARDKIMNFNYSDLIAWAAGFDKGMNGRFYPTEEEVEGAKQVKEKLKDDFVILWALAGSSHHKIYPYCEHIWGEMLTRGWNVKIITVGDEHCKMLENPDYPSLIHASGKWNIRQSMAYIPFADLIIGPETGLMNAAGGTDTPQITMLSHSSANNLTKYWKKNENAIPDNCGCYPCHILHHTDSCPKDAINGAALCAALNDANKIFAMIEKQYDAWCIRNGRPKSIPEIARI